MTDGEEEGAQAHQVQEHDGARDQVAQEKGRSFFAPRPEVALARSSSGFYWTPAGVRCARTHELIDRDAVATLRAEITGIALTTSDPKTMARAQKALRRPVVL